MRVNNAYGRPLSINHGGKVDLKIVMELELVGKSTVHLLSYLLQNYLSLGTWISLNYLNFVQQIWILGWDHPLLVTTLIIDKW